jgi:hypothetical protein
MLTENTRMMRTMFMPITIQEHHQMIDPVLSNYGICDRLGALWLGAGTRNLSGWTTAHPQLGCSPGGPVSEGRSHDHRPSFV